MISKEVIIKKVASLLKQKNCIINEEVKPFIDEYNGPFSKALKENYKIAQKEKLPLCQDTGMVEFFVFLGNRTILEEPIDASLNKAVGTIYTEMPFRYSVVKDPLFERKNTKTNTPSVVHMFPKEGKDLEIRFLIKGGGSENLTRLFMMKPSSTVEELKKVVIAHVKENGARGCPPLHIGIGIGGSADKAIVLSKLALTKDFNDRNKTFSYANLEEELLKELNELELGFQGLKSGISVYSVHIEDFPTHIATLPVGISIDCYLCRNGVIKFEDN